MNIYRPDKWYEHIASILLMGDTRAARFWLAIVNLCFVSYMWVSLTSDKNFELMLATIPYHSSSLWWMGGFLIHALYLFKGLNGKYDGWTLMFEGVLGWVLWSWTAATHWASQGMPGPTFACALMMTWILIRYPTHWTQWGRRDD